MKKNYFILVILLIMVVGYAATQMKIDIKGNTTLSENTSDFNVYLANLKLNGTEIEGINATKDGYEINVPSKGILEYDVINDSTEYDVEATVECEEETGANEVTNFDYTGSEQTFVAPVTGVYKLETWGAQGYTVNSYTGGYGGYSIGKVNFSKNQKIYLFVGEKGKGGIGNGTRYSSYPNSLYATAADNVSYIGSGGGSTHIVNKNLLIKDITDLSDLIMVSGGGGSSTWTSGNQWAGTGGAGGGYIGNSGKSTIESYTPGGGGTQTSGGSSGNGGTAGQFGLSLVKYTYETGGGGGFYGGGTSWGSAGGGGSGYIGNPFLMEKTMYCYNCQESTEESTKTISTTCVNSTPTENCAKSGNGYARITLTKAINPNVQLETTTIEAQDKVNKSVEISNKGMTCSLKIKKLSRTEKKVYNGPTEWTFDYTGGEQTFTVPVTGTYKLETWGAQGGSYSSYHGGYGGYSTGIISLKLNSDLFINVGGAGRMGAMDVSGVEVLGGYNGGGANTSAQYGYGTTGGGATHIATISGLLESLGNKKDDLLIVSGGGGGGGQETAYIGYCYGGSAGGITGSKGTSNPSRYEAPGNVGTQSSGYVFGKGEASSSWIGSGGSGFFGGYKGCGGGGGSGYIGNSLLTEKSMYCCNCEESKEESTKTISTTCVNSTPTENCAKQGNGYARITLIK